jgi:hypothetical protein
MDNESRSDACPWWRLRNTLPDAVYQNGFQGFPIAVFTSPEFATTDQISCIAFDAHSPISSTGFDELKGLSTIFIHIMFTTFILPPPNAQFL